MNGLRIRDRPIRWVVEGTGQRLDTLERWSASAFITAGGLLLVGTVLTGLGAVTPLSLPETVTGVITITGVVLMYGGVFGLYPRHANHSPRLALAGVGLLGLPAMVLVAVMVWGVSGHIFRTVPVPPAVIPYFGMVFVAVFLLSGLGISLFGVANLRSPDISPVVGALLLVLAATWFVLLGASSMYGSTFPAWLDIANPGVMATVLLALGCLVRSQTGSI